MSTQEIVSTPEGARVKFKGERRWWDVRADSGRFSVLTRQAEFHEKGVLCYTIIDRRRGVRGPCNEIGQGWGDGTFSDSECADLLQALVNHEESERIRSEASEEMWEPLDGLKGRSWVGPELPWPTVEVSYRNNVEVRIEEVVA